MEPARQMVSRANGPGPMKYLTTGPRTIRTPPQVDSLDAELVQCECAGTGLGGGMSVAVA